MEWFLDAGIDEQRAVESFEGDLETFMEICAVVNPGNDPVINDTLTGERRKIRNRLAAIQSRMNRQERIANLRNML